MRIEDAIKQTSFKTSHEKAAVNLLFTYNWFRDLSSESLKPFGLKMQHYNVLRILNGRHPEAHSPGEIKDVMLDKSPDLTRLLDKLVKMGLADRHLCPENRRKMDIHITEQGINMLKEVRAKHGDSLEAWSQNLSDSEAEQLSNLLDKVRG